MAHFFCDAVSGSEAVLLGEEAKHIARVLRMREGERLTVSTPDGMEHDCVITLSSPEQVLLTVERSYPNETEPRVKVTLFQALPKSDKMDLIVQKAIELGVTEIVPMLTKRCVSRPDGKTAAKKVERWQKIAKEAAKQSGRGIIPQIHPLVSWQEALAMASKAQAPLLFYEGGGERLNRLISPATQTVAMLIGSEGGFEAEEVAQAKASGIRAATLGKRILRCETAPLAALAVVMNLTEDL